jgi:large subunit ribosomal protein L4
MTALTLKNIDFNKGTVDSKKVEVSTALEIESAKSVAYVVRWQLASRRSGSAKVKSMDEISGTTAKPWKQKGTGRARQGSRRSVQFVGGRTCHGPTPRSFDFSMPKKIVKKALADVLRLKLKENKITLFSDFGTIAKTSKLSATLTKNSITSALILFDGTEKNNQFLAKSAKNLKNVKALDAKAMNVYDILNFDHLLVDSKSFETNILGALA